MLSIEEKILTLNSLRLLPVTALRFTFLRFTLYTGSWSVVLKDFTYATEAHCCSF